MIGKSIYRLTETDIRIFEKAKSDGRYFTDYYFGGWVFDHNIDPPWQLAMHHAAQTQIVAVTGTGAGKTGAVGISASVWSATTPNFKFMNVAPSVWQSEQMYNYILQQAEGNRFDRFIHKTIIKPYPKIVLKAKIPRRLPAESEEDWVVSTSTLEFMTAGQNANLILSFEGDWINIDEAGLLDDLDEILIRLVTRLRGSVRGRPRLGRISMLSNPHPNPSFYYYYDMGAGDPEHCLSIQRPTRSNQNITREQLRQQLKMIPEHLQDRWMAGERPEGEGKEFPATLIDPCEDPGLDFIQDENKGQPGFVLERSERAGVTTWQMPRDPHRRYLVVMDPGQGMPPFRNAPVITVWDITDFPRLPAVLRAFWWGSGGGTYAPCISTFKHYFQLYHASFGVHDSTGTQSGFEEMFNLQEGMMVYGINLAGNAKNECHLALKMLMNKGLMKWPRSIKGIRQQLANYELPDKKLVQDIVSNFQMAAGFLRRFYWVEQDDGDEGQEKTRDFDRRDRVSVNRAERSAVR